MAEAKQEAATVILLKGTEAKGSGWGAIAAKPTRYGLQFAEGYADSYDEMIDWNGCDPESLVGQSVTVTISARSYIVETGVGSKVRQSIDQT